VRVCLDESGNGHEDHDPDVQDGEDVVEPVIDSNCQENDLKL